MFTTRLNKCLQLGTLDEKAEREVENPLTVC